MTKSYDIRDIQLSKEGKKKIEWAYSQMPVLKNLMERFSKSKPFKGLRIGTCLHVTSETANLMILLKAGGADVSICASNPLSTQDMVASSLVKDYGIKVYAIHGEDNKTYYSHLQAVLSLKPNITMDDGGDLINMLHKMDISFQKSEIRIKNFKKEIWEFFGSSEETTTGVIRLKAMEKDKALKVPVIAVNESATKHLFDNRYGTGQSTVDGVLRATNILLAGKKAVVAGYGWCGRGIANRLRGMGAVVTVLEVDPVKALEAVMDGFSVDRISEAVKYADLIITATGDKHIINLAHMLSAKDGMIMANSGHFNVEIDYDGLAKKAKSRRILRSNLEEFVMPSGKKLYVLGEGRLVNLAAADGHPADVMDMSFADQAMAAKYFIDNKGKLEPKVYTLPPELDTEVAGIKLKAMGVKYDQLTAEQKKYLASWKEGT